MLATKRFRLVRPSGAVRAQSTNGQGGYCARAYSCQAVDDICRSNDECCGHACSANNDGGVGRCASVSGGGGGGCDQAASPYPLFLDGVNVSFDVPSANISVPGNIMQVCSSQVIVQAPMALAGQSSVQVKVIIDEAIYSNVVTTPVAGGSQ